jgi:hypothetical protein
MSRLLDRTDTDELIRKLLAEFQVGKKDAGYWYIYDRVIVSHGLMSREDIAELVGSYVSILKKK